MVNLINLMNDMRQRLGWDKTDDLDSLIGYLNEEVQELTIEAQANPIDEVALQQEIVDVLIVVLALIDDLKIDIEVQMKNKIKMIIAKYEHD